MIKEFVFVGKGACPEQNVVAILGTDLLGITGFLQPAWELRTLMRDEEL